MNQSFHGSGLAGMSPPETRVHEPVPRGMHMHGPFGASHWDFRKAALLVLILSSLAAYNYVWGEYSSLVLPGFFMVVLSVASLTVPMEWLLVINTVAFVLADSFLDLSSLNYYYTRFMPLGMFAVRSLLPSTLQKVRPHMLPGFFIKPFGLLFLMALISASYDRLDPAATVLRALTMGFLLTAFGIGLPAYALDNDQRIRRMLRSIMIVIALSIAVGFVLIPFSKKTLLELGSYVRVRGIYSHPNTLGLMAMLTFYPFVGWRLVTRRGERWPLTIALFIILMAVLTSGSRASLAGLVSGGVAFFTFRRSDTRNKVALALLFLLALLLFLGIPRIDDGLLRTDTGWRPELWERALHLGADSPVLGSGFGSTNLVFSDDKPNLIRNQIYAGGSHNEYARIFVGMGGLGLFLALFGFALVLVRAIRVIRIEKGPAIPVSLLAAVVSGLTNAIFEDWVFAFGGAPAFPFWFFFALLALYGHRGTFLRKAHWRRYRLKRIDPSRRL